MKQKCVEFMQDLQSRDLNKIGEWFLEDSQVWVPPASPVTGSNRILALFRAILKRYNSIQWKVTEVHHLEQNRYFYISESWGMTGTSMPYRNTIATDITFNPEGKIERLSDYFKDTAVFG
jgi:hypothetical protein